MSTEDSGRSSLPTARYLPSPEEIAKLTAEIRKNWTDDEYKRRASVTNGSAVSMPAIKLVKGPRVNRPEQ